MFTGDHPPPGPDDPEYLLPLELGVLYAGVSNIRVFEFWLSQLPQCTAGLNVFMVPPGTNVVSEPPVLVGGQDSGHYNVPTWLIICNMRVSLNKRHCKPLLLLREECEVLHPLHNLVECHVGQVHDRGFPYPESHIISYVRCARRVA